MNFKIMFFIFTVTQVAGINCFFRKMILNDSQAGKSMHALHAFWYKKLSDDLKKECSKHNNCEELTQHMSNVIAFALKRQDAARVAESIKKLEKNTATPEDVLNASFTIESYGHAIIEDDTLTTLKREPTVGFPFTVSFFKSSLQEIEESIAEIGKKSEWSQEKIEHEKKHVVQTLKDFLLRKQHQ